MGKAELRVAAGYVLTELGRALREAGSDPDNYVQRVRKLKVMCAASSSRASEARNAARSDCKPVITPRMHRIFARQ